MDPSFSESKIDWAVVLAYSSRGKVNLNVEPTLNLEEKVIFPSYFYAIFLDIDSPNFNDSYPLKMLNTLS